VFRFALAVIVVGLLFTTSSLLHFLSITYLAGVLSGLLLGGVLWFRLRGSNPKA
jgi:hypothetical protein